MSRLDECYNSLDNAKNELASLENKCKKYDGFFERFKMLDVYLEKDMPVKDLIALYDTNYKNGRNKLIRRCLIGYPAIWVALFLAGILLSFNPASGVAVATTLFTNANYETFKKISQDKRKRKFLCEVLEEVDKSEEEANYTIDELMAELKNQDSEMVTKIVEGRRAILEYEKLIEESKERIANEVIVAHGIDAEINVSFVRRPKKNKSLIKVYVNK